MVRAGRLRRRLGRRERRPGLDRRHGLRHRPPGRVRPRGLPEAPPGRGGDGVLRDPRVVRPGARSTGGATSTAAPVDDQRRPARPRGAGRGLRARADGRPSSPTGRAPSRARLERRLRRQVTRRLLGEAEKVSRGRRGGHHPRARAGGPRGDRRQHDGPAPAAGRPRDLAAHQPGRAARSRRRTTSAGRSSAGLPADHAAAAAPAARPAAAVDAPTSVTPSRPRCASGTSRATSRSWSTPRPPRRRAPRSRLVGRRWRPAGWCWPPSVPDGQVRPTGARPATTGQPCGSTGRSRCRLVESALVDDPDAADDVRAAVAACRRRRRRRGRDVRRRRRRGPRARVVRRPGARGPGRARVLTDSVRAARPGVARWRPWTPSPRSPHPSTSRSGSTPRAAPSAPSSSRRSSGWPASRAS